MSTPAYSHTYTYSRVGVGDVIALDTAGEPYTLSVSLPAGWTANYWYASDPLASVIDLAKWTQLALPGPLPTGARKIAVNVVSISAQTPSSDRLKFTVSSTSYKAATGHRYTDSGAHSSNFGSELLFGLGVPIHHFDATDQSTLFQDTAGLTPVLDNDPVGRFNNKGSDGTPLLQGTAGERPLWREDHFGVGLHGIEFDGIDDHLLGASFPHGFPNGDYQWMCVFAKDLDPSTTEYMISWDPFQHVLTSSAGSQRQATVNMTGSTTVSRTVQPVNVPVAGLARHEPGNAAFGSFSWNPGTGIKGGSETGPANNDTFALGGFDGVSNFADYVLIELAYWTFTTGPTPAELQSYLLGTYGLTVGIEDPR